jgi:large subunit ribosomal protein L31
VTGSTQETIRTDVCYKCHPFFTGEQRIVDTEGQVDRFMKKLRARDEFEAEKQAREETQVDPSRAITELELGARAEKSLTEAGITEVGQVFDRLVESEEGLLAIKGFGQKSLSDLKKALRKIGYKLSEATEEVNA